MKTKSKLAYLLPMLRPLSSGCHHTITIHASHTGLPSTTSMPIKPRYIKADNIRNLGQPFRVGRPRTHDPLRSSQIQGHS